MACAVGIAALALGVTTTSCGEFVRNNPFDPAVPVKITIQGPDSAFAQFDTLRFTLTTDPVYDYAGLVEWQIGGLQRIDNNGTYQVGPIANYSGQPTRVSVTARIGSRTASKDVDIVFKPAGFAVHFCSDGSHTATFSAIGQRANLCASVLDARGGVISTTQNPPLPSRSLDTTVVQVDTLYASITAVGNGTTSVIFNYGSFMDSVRVTVRQAVGTLTVSPAACGSKQYAPTPMPMAFGDTLRLTLGMPAYDVGGRPITDPAIVQQAIADVVWGPYPFMNDVPIDITSDGLVTATTRGFARLGAVLGSNPAFPVVVATCSIQVQ
jgi:hypothetical protein